MCQQVGGFFKESKFRDLFKSDLDQLSTELGYQLINITIEDIHNKFIINVTIGNKKSQYNYTIESLASTGRSASIGMANFLLISENNTHKRQTILILTQNKGMIDDLVGSEPELDNVSNFYRFFEDKGLDYCFFCTKTLKQGELPAFRTELKSLPLQKSTLLEFEIQACLAFESVFKTGFEQLVIGLLKAGVKTEFFIEEDIFGAKKLLRSLKMLGKWDQLLKFDKQLLERPDSITCLEISKKILNLNDIIKNDDDLTTEQKLFRRNKHLVLINLSDCGAFLKRPKFLDFYRHAIRTAGIVINYRSNIEENLTRNRAFNRVFMGSGENDEFLLSQKKAILKNLQFWKLTRNKMSLCFFTQSYSWELDKMRRASDYVVEVSPRIYKHVTNSQNPLKRFLFYEIEWCVSVYMNIT